MNTKYYILITLMILFLSGCSDDYLKIEEKPNPEVPTVEAYLDLSVKEMVVSTGRTRAEDGEEEEPEEIDEDAIISEAEKRIDDIWVFQFAADTENHELLITPIYYPVYEGDNLNNFKILLKEDTPSYICVVANTKNPGWVNQTNITEFDTYSKFKNHAIPRKGGYHYILQSELTTENSDVRKSIPMEGENIGEEGNGITVQFGHVYTVNVTKMFAKLVISYGNIPEGMTKKSIQINNIPNYCRVESLGAGINEDEGATYPDEWVSRGLNTASGAEDKYVIYIPENLQGKNANDDPVLKPDVSIAPSKALKFDFLMAYGGDRYYYVCPGGDIYRDYNIKRNFCYNIKININSTSTDNYTPSSNCFVVKPGEELVFEPYYRVETGGQDGSADDYIFDFKNYLDPEDETDKKKIDRVQILWQTKGAIGDNTNGDLVAFELNEQYPIHSKIRVKQAQDENGQYPVGNAVIAAYNKYKNEDGEDVSEIIWSWHIWRTTNDPANVGNAVVYTTYEWDENKIYSLQQAINDGTVYERVAGYAIMSCNLGALADKPLNSDNSTNINDVNKTYGMLYQWGRKDPFPPMIKYIGGTEGYNEDTTGLHYDYTNEKRVYKINDTNYTIPETGVYSNYPEAVFFSNEGNQTLTLSNPLRFAIQHPLIFMCGAKDVSSADGNNKSLSNFFNNGDWLPAGFSNDKLWGGLDPIDDSSVMKKLYISAMNRNLYDNYGDKKTIFDPCPSGWRVPPGDLWLGFSKTGLNPNDIEKINRDELLSTGRGIYLYIEKSRWDNNGNVLEDRESRGRSLYFPTQGGRLSAGGGYHVGACGNYQNATTTKGTLSVYGSIVNTLHVHHDSSNFRIFENGDRWFLAKSVAGPIRCVRDRK